MKRLALHALVLGIITSLMFTSASLAAKNPCNPCNPCSMSKVFTINDNRNVFTFESKAPLEKIVGTTSKITGQAKVNLNDITKNVMVKFELDLASMKTGIALRDEHMREKFLNTGKYPKAVLTINRVTKASHKMLMDQKPVTVDAVGTLELHGVKKQITLKDVQITYFKESEATKAKMPGNLLAIEGGFSIKLPDYNIEVPQMIMLKLDEKIHAKVNLIATTATTMMAANPCNPCNPCSKKMKNPCNPCNPCGKKAKKNPCNPCNPCSKKAKKKW